MYVEASKDRAIKIRGMTHGPMNWPYPITNGYRYAWMYVSKHSQGWTQKPVFGQCIHFVESQPSIDKNSMNNDTEEHQGKGHDFWGRRLLVYVHESKNFCSVLVYIGPKIEVIGAVLIEHQSDDLVHAKYFAKIEWCWRTNPALFAGKADYNMLREIQLWLSVFYNAFVSCSIIRNEPAHQAHDWLVCLRTGINRSEFLVSPMLPGEITFHPRIHGWCWFRILHSTVCGVRSFHNVDPLNDWINGETKNVSWLTLKVGRNKKHEQLLKIKRTWRVLRHRAEKGASVWWVLRLQTLDRAESWANKIIDVPNLDCLRISKV
jgi:hypothetical protein